jgi:aspartate aminotransferase
MNTISPRIANLLDHLGPVHHFFTQSSYARRAGDPTICDFALGNPQEPPLAGFAEALGRWSAPQGNDWFVYKMSEPAVC